MSDSIPFDIAAEDAVISACILDNSYISSVGNLLTPEDFSINNQNLFRAVLDLEQRGQKVDTVTVFGWLKDRRLHDPTRGAAPIAHIVDATPAVSNVLDHAGMVASKSTLRRVREAAEGIYRNSQEQVTDFESFCDESIRAIQVAVASQSTESRRHSWKGILDEAAQVALLPKERKRAGLTTLCSDLDTATRGFMRANVWFIAAMSHWGKTMYSTACSLAHAEDKKRSVIVSGEDDQSLYGLRALSIKTGIPTIKLTSGRLNAEERSLVGEARSNLDDSCVFINAVGKTPEWAARETRAVIASEGVDMVWFDYVQAYEAKSKGDNMRERINHAVDHFIDTIKCNDVAGAIFSQITPPQGQTKPSKSDLRGSKDMGNRAEVVAIGMKDDGRRVMLLEKNKGMSGESARVGDAFSMASNTECGFFVRDSLPDYEFSKPMEMPPWQDA